MTKQDTDTRTKIIKSAGKLLSQRGYFGASMQDIAEDVGISKAALYYHFSSKDELVEILLREAVKELKSELKDALINSELPSDVLFNTTKVFLDFKSKHPEISLLNSLVPKPDEEIHIFTVMLELRQELIEFISSIIEELDNTRKITYGTIFTITTTIIGFLLSPIAPLTNKNAKQLSDNLANLLKINTT